MARSALAATRALDILSFLAEHPNEAFTMAQLTRALRLNQGSAHAILSTMTEHGFLTRHPAHRTFRLGPALVCVGEAAVGANPLITVAGEELHTLSDALALPALASIRTGTELRVVVRVGPHVANGPARRVGQRYPLVPPLGVVLVAWSPPSVQDAWIAARPAGMAAEDVVGLLQEVRARGYDVGGGVAARRALQAAARQLADTPLDEHARATVRTQAGLVPRTSEDDIAVVTVPVLDASGHAVLECSVHGFRVRPTAATVRKVAVAARDACTMIARRAGAAGDVRLGHGKSERAG
jgi:DNA-binding IclR family transcriptional regulator